MSERYDEFDRALLRAGRTARAPAGMRSRALAAAAGAGGATALAATKASAGVFASLAAKCAIVAAVGTASIGAVALAAHEREPALVETPAAVPALPPPAYVQYAPIAPKAIEPAVALAEPEPPPAVVRAGAPAVTATAPEAPRPPAPSALAEEIRLVDAARRSLARGDAGEALRLADEHASRFPSGTFAVEREVVRIDALVASGRTREAADAARAFLADHPGAAQAARIENIAARP